MKQLRFKKLFLLVFFLLTLPSLSSAEENQTAVPKQPKSSSRDLPIQSVFQKDNAQVEVLADSLEYAKEQNKIIGKGNVTISYENTQLTSDYAEVETDSKKAYARGHVVVFKNGTATAYGDEVTYDFTHDSGSFPDGRSYNFPWFSTGRDFEQPKKGVKIIKQGSLTSCNLENPHYVVKAKKITIREGDKLIAQNVTFYVLGKPIF